VPAEVPGGSSYALVSNEELFSLLLGGLWPLALIRWNSQVSQKPVIDWELWKFPSGLDLPPYSPHLRLFLCMTAYVHM